MMRSIWAILLVTLKKLMARVRSLRGFAVNDALDNYSDLNGSFGPILSGGQSGRLTNPSNEKGIQTISPVGPICIHGKVEPPPASSTTVVARGPNSGGGKNLSQELMGNDSPVLETHSGSNLKRVRKAKSQSGKRRKVAKVTAEVIPLRDGAKRKQRQKVIRTEAERRMLEQIAGFFDDTSKAYSLLRRNINNGFITTPEKELSIQEFLQAQREAWESRESLGTPHSIRFLQNGILTRELMSTGFDRQSGELPNLDQIEGHRDLEGQYKGKYGKHY